MLRCFQRLSIPNIATRHLYLVVKPVHQRFVQSGPLVLGSTLLRYQTPVTDRDQPVSRRFEPSSRALLIGEQTNAWELLHPRARASRHRIFHSSPITRRIGLYLHPPGGGVGMLARKTLLTPFFKPLRRQNKSLRGHIEAERRSEIVSLLHIRAEETVVGEAGTLTRQYPCSQAPRTRILSQGTRTQG